MMKEFFLQPGTRRMFIAALLIFSFNLLAWLHLDKEYVMLMGNAMNVAVGFWFGQHTNKPPTA